MFKLVKILRNSWSLKNSTTDNPFPSYICVCCFGYDSLDIFYHLLLQLS